MSGFQMPLHKSVDKFGKNDFLSLALQAIFKVIAHCSFAFFQDVEKLLSLDAWQNNTEGFLPHSLQCYVTLPMKVKREKIIGPVALNV